MRIELSVEQKFNAEPWYIVRVDGQYITGTGIKEKAEELYNKLVSDPEMLKTKVNILKSQEINVPLSEINQ